MDFENLEEGLKILFNDRKTPLTVEEKDEDRAVVEGPNGGRYEIFTDEGTLLVSKEGNRRYSSYCEDLRSVGEWMRDEFSWVHSKTDAKVELVRKENGFWNVETEGLEDSIDTPMYGYSDREFAEEDAQKFVDKHPEGR
ncbi:MAG: hypothetical protein BRC30_02710 [Nanohaloarchaea archaeon SW_7_46_7]|nr:MAG: hypothetical protein BRC30_02710 [Nanohaloarchaea archaeon SW_7_46_7]